MSRAVYKKRSIEERFMAKVNQDGPIHPVLGTPCWLWTGYISKRGYGRFSMTKTHPVGSHQASLHILRGQPIVRGRQIQVDHLCRNTACVNPNHLELVPGAVNMARAVAARVKTVCRHGHPLTEANTYLERGLRRCRACHAAQEQRRRNRGIATNQKGRAA